MTAPTLRAAHAPLWAAAPTATALKQFGRFRIRRVLGTGWYGTAYHAHDPQVDRDVTLKVPGADVRADPGRSARFRALTRAAGRLNHPSILPVFEIGQHDGQDYAVSAWVEGRSLRDALSADGLAPHRVASIVRHLADALTYAQEQALVHGDIQPATILIDAEDVPYLTDFGLAERGAPAYRAPELVDGLLGTPNAASDQYALGVLLYELLTGHVPDTGPLPRSVPAGLAAICRKCLARRSEDRYANCAVLADELRRYLAGEPLRTRPPSLRENLARLLGVYWQEVALGLALLLVTLTGVTLWRYTAARAAEANARADRAAERIRQAEELTRQLDDEEAAHVRRAADAAARLARETERLQKAQEREQAATLALKKLTE